MIKTKLLAAVLALGVTGVANAAIQTAANSELVFSAWDSVSGVGYTFDLADIGFNEAFGSNVLLNSLIGSTNTNANVTTTLLASPANGIVFDLALSSFNDFASQVNLTNVQWNLLSADVAGTRRILQTSAVALTSALDNQSITNASNNISLYTAAVSGKGANRGDFAADDSVITKREDGTAYAGDLGSGLKVTGYYQTAGALDQELALYVISSAGGGQNGAGRVAELLDAEGKSVVAKVYLGDDGYRLQVAVVPEPETYAMLLAGLGLLGFAARRNRA